MRLFILIFLILSFSFSASLFGGSTIFRSRSSAEAIVADRAIDTKLLAKLVLEETNRYRVSRGRRALAYYRPLLNAAQSHANAMAKTGFFAHKNPFDRSQRTLSDRVNDAGLKSRAYAENIAYTYSCQEATGHRASAAAARDFTYRQLAKSVTAQWINSRGHRANMLGRSYSYIGLGFAKARDKRGMERVYCVQTFSADPYNALVSSRN